MPAGRVEIEIGLEDVLVYTIYPVIVIEIAQYSRSLYLGEVVVCKDVENRRVSWGDHPYMDIQSDVVCGLRDHQS